jgi:hypothetical protein
MGHFDELAQPHERWPVDGQVFGVVRLAGTRDEFGLVGQHERSLRRHHTQWFVRSVEHQRPGHQGNLTPDRRRRRRPDVLGGRTVSVQANQVIRSAVSMSAVSSP